MPGESQHTTDAREILHRRYFEGRPEMMQELEQARAAEEIALQIWELRTAAGL